MTIVFKLIINSQEHDVSDLVRTYRSIDRACNEEFRHAVSTRVVTFRYTTELLSLLTVDGVIATVDLDGEKDFTGRVAPSSLRVQSYGATVSGLPDVEDIEVELEDFTYKLEREITSSDGLVIENAYVCNPLYPTQSIVHRLLSLTDVQYEISLTINTQLLGFAIDEGKIKDVLDTLLYEYGFTYQFDPYGKLILVQYLYDNPTPSVVLTETEIQAPLEIEKLPKEAEAVEVSYYPLQAKTNVLLYMADLPFGENGLRSGWPIQPGLLWPEEANVQETWFVYDDKALTHRVNERGEIELNKEFTSIVLTKNHTLEERFEFGIQREIAIFENRRARLAYRNTDAIPRLIYYCNIRGDVVYRSAEVVLRYELDPNPASVDRYDALYIHDGEAARKLCAFRSERIRSACWRYRFKMDTSLSLASILRLVDPYAGIDTIVLLIERSLDAETNVYEYRAIGLSAPTLIQPLARAKRLQGPLGPINDELALLYSARLVLSPESCSLESDWNGIVDFSKAKTRIEVWMAEKEDTSSWALSVAESPGVRGYLINQEYYISRLDTDAGFVDIQATHKNIGLISPSYAKWGQRFFGTLRFAKAMQLTRRFYVSKIAPVGSQPISEHLPSDPAFMENLANYIFIEKLFSKYIKLQSGGSIRGGNRYTEDGTDTGQAVPGFWQGANGQLKIADGQIDIKDSLNRRIKISTTDGLKALDAQGKIIHDIPDQAIANGEYYMGHLVWWHPPQIIFYAEGLLGNNTYEIAVLTRNYQNIKGVLLNISAKGVCDSLITFLDNRVDIWPKGEIVGAITPGLYFSRPSMFSGSISVETTAYLIVPIGSENKICIRNRSGTNGLILISILQMGIVV